MAVAALVLGIGGMVTCLFPVGIVGLILGIIALVRENNEPQRYGGRGMAVGGIVTGGISILLIPVMALMISVMLPSLSRARELAKRAVNSANLRGIGQAALIYANNNAEAFPPDLNTLLAKGLCAPQQMIDPSSGSVPPACDYYYVAGLTNADDPLWIVAYCDPTYHNGEGATVLFLDGHTKFIEEPGFTTQLDAFFTEFEQDRGAPPVVIPPK